MAEQEQNMEAFERYFRAALIKTAQACELAVTDILNGRDRDGKVDTKALKDLSGCMKDLNGLGGESGKAPLQVLFSAEAERYGS